MGLVSDDKRMELTIEVLLNSYNRIGEEVLSNQKLQIQSLQIGILAIIALLGYISTSKEYLLTVYIPVLIVLVTHVYLHFDNQTSICGIYNFEIENKLNIILNWESEKIIYWEHQFGGLIRGISKEYVFSIKVIALLIAGIYILFSSAGVLFLFERYGFIWAILLGSLYFTLIVLEIRYFRYLVELRRPYQIISEPGGK